MIAIDSKYATKKPLGGKHTASKVQDEMETAGLWAVWIFHRLKNGIIDDAKAIDELKSIADRFSGGDTNGR